MVRLSFALSGNAVNRNRAGRISWREFPLRCAWIMNGLKARHNEECTRRAVDKNFLVDSAEKVSNARWDQPATTTRETDGAKEKSAGVENSRSRRG